MSFMETVEVEREILSNNPVTESHVINSAADDSSELTGGVGDEIFDNAADPDDPTPMPQNSDQEGSEDENSDFGPTNRQPVINQNPVTDHASSTTPANNNSAIGKETSQLPANSNSAVGQGIPQPPAKKKKKNSGVADKILSELGKLEKEKEDLRNIMKEPTQPTAVPAPPPPPAQESDIDVFFRGISSTVKTLPPLVKAKVKSAIFSIVSRAEIEALSVPSHSSNHGTEQSSQSVLSPLTLLSSVSMECGSEDTQFNVLNFDNY
ncbi:uncharacterized protein [Bemisia tabaci]